MADVDHQESVPAVSARRSRRVRRCFRGAGESGEGVISAAIAVLVMAFLGVAMWAAFKTTFDRAAVKIDEQISEIGG